MQKIPTLFERDWDGDRSRVTPQPTPGCEWVFEGEGIPTRKYDGTCVMMDEDGKWWARREVKPGKNPPPGFMSSGHDHITLKDIGWEPIEGSPFVKFWHEAVLAPPEGRSEWESGTYELVGPKIQGNPEGYHTHQLIGHAGAQVLVLHDDMLTFEGLRSFLNGSGIEGIVFHHPDGRMAKIKQRDFGLKRG